jgi:hypothetical protein
VDLSYQFTAPSTTDFQDPGRSRKHTVRGFLCFRCTRMTESLHLAGGVLRPWEDKRSQWLREQSNRIKSPQTVRFRPPVFGPRRRQGLRVECLQFRPAPPISNKPQYVRRDPLRLWFIKTCFCVRIPDTCTRFKSNFLRFLPFLFSRRATGPRGVRLLSTRSLVSSVLGCLLGTAVFHNPYTPNANPAKEKEKERLGEPVELIASLVGPNQWIYSCSTNA